MSHAADAARVAEALIAEHEAGPGVSCAAVHPGGPVDYPCEVRLAAERLAEVLAGYVVEHLRADLRRQAHQRLRARNQARAAY